MLAKAVPLASLCQHHLLPFVGVAHVGYLPAGRILGRSKLARVVELFARRLQLQQRLTTQVAGWLQAQLAQGRRGGAGGRAPVHVAARGAAPAARAVTSTLHGRRRTDPRPCQELLALTGAAT